MTRLREAADDSLRELARSTLEKALRGEQVDKQQLDAARSLFSYRADQPPSQHRDADGDGVRLANGRPVHTLADLVELSLQYRHALETPELLAACRRVVAAADNPGSAVSLESRSSETA